MQGVVCMKSLAHVLHTTPSIQVHSVRCCVNSHASLIYNLTTQTLILMATALPWRDGSRVSEVAVGYWTGVTKTGHH